MTNPPTPRRCQRILQAHRLRCQGLSLRQIAAELGCAHSTVSAYLRDFQLHRQYILETFVAEQLVDQVQQLVQPGQEPQEHQQHVAAARELRLLLGTLAKLQAGPQRQRADAETAAAIALARRRQPNSTGPDGHSRDEHGRCHPNCPMCRPEIYEAREARLERLSPEHQTALEQFQPARDPSPEITSKPDQIRPDPNKPDHPEPEFPAPDRKFSSPAQEPRPQPKIGPQYPASWDNPLGYIYEPEKDPLLQRMFGRR